MNNRESLLRKIKALSERGEGGEAINASEKLKQLMEQYGINERDLEDEHREDCQLRYHGTFGQNLMHQVVYMVMGDVPVYTLRRMGKPVPNIIVVECTKAEQIEIQAAFDFYRHHLDVGLKRYYDAFVQKENLFPDSSKKQSEGKTTIDPETARLFHSIDKHDRHPQLESGRK